jgi:serine/threonine protein kinase
LIYDIRRFKECPVATKKEFYDSLFNVAKIRFNRSEKIKGNGITKHPFTITYADDKTSTGVLIKRSGFGGHHNRKKADSFFGDGSYKMVTEVILQIGNNAPMKCAMSTEEPNGDPWQGDTHLKIQREILKESYSTINGSLIVPITTTKQGTGHFFGQKSQFTEKNLGFMPIVEPPKKNTKHNYPQLINYIKGLLNSLLVLIENGWVHQDIKLDNTGVNGELLDLDNLGSMNQTYTHYGTNGHHPLPQMLSKDDHPDFITKQKQDAYATAITLLWVILGRNPKKIFESNFQIVENYNLGFTFKFHPDFDANAYISNLYSTINGISLTQGSNTGVDEAFRQLLWDMTGTGITKYNPYSTGNNCYGKELQHKIEIFLNELDKSARCAIRL